MRWADLESTWVRVNEVSPCTIVAPITATTIGRSNWVCFLPMTSSTRYLVEPGRIIPLTRLIAIKRKPRTRIPRRGWINAQTSGKDFHSNFFFVFLAASGSAAVVAGGVLDVFLSGIHYWMREDPRSLQDILLELAAASHVKQKILPTPLLFAR